jgi:hypothetical protein
MPSSPWQATGDSAKVLAKGEKGRRIKKEEGRKKKAERKRDCSTSLAMETRTKNLFCYKIFDVKFFDLKNSNQGGIEARRNALLFLVARACEKDYNFSP